MSSTKKTKVSKVQEGSKARAVAPAKATTKQTAKTAAKPSPKAVLVKSATGKGQAVAAAAKKAGIQKTVASASVKGAKSRIKEPKVAKGTIVAAAPAAKSAPPAKPAKSKYGSLPATLKNLSAPPSAQPQPRSLVRAAQQKPEKKLTARPPSLPVVLTPDYRPAENEPFMNELHRAYFRQKLNTWKDEIIRQTKETLVILHEDSVQHADIADRATSETDRSLELRARDRQRKLIAKIDAALSRIDDGSYGYCEETGEPIGLKRLEARPIATLSLEAQERHERREKVYRED